MSYYNPCFTCQTTRDISHYRSDTVDTVPINPTAKRIRLRRYIVQHDTYDNLMLLDDWTECQIPVYYRGTWYGKTFEEYVRSLRSNV